MDRKNKKELIPLNISLNEDDLEVSTQDASVLVRESPSLSISKI